ncbi:MAG TPA: WYL domain-containing protein [Actinomycetota bacterium]
MLELPAKLRHHVLELAFCEAARTSTATHVRQGDQDSALADAHAGVAGPPRPHSSPISPRSRGSFETFVRPPGFDLERAWAEHSLPDLPPPDRVAVTVLADPVQAALFYRLAASHVIERAEDGDSAILEFPAADAAAGFIASFGALVEVLDPPEIRARLGEIGRELSGLYR